MSSSLAEVRAHLERLRLSLQTEGDVAIEPSSTAQLVAKPDDDAAPLHEMHQAIASARNRERTRQLQQIDHALARLDENPDDFGQCTACSEAIPARRILLMPWVELCIDCQAEREQDAPRSRKHLNDYR